MSNVTAMMSRRSSVVELRFPTDVSGDEDAYRFIATNVHHPERNNWLALQAPDRLPQTVRVLASISQNVQAQGAERRANHQDDEAEHHAGRISDGDWVEIQAEYKDWKARAGWFKNAVDGRLREAKQLLRQHNVEDASRRTAAEDRVFRDMLAKLTDAVHSHQEQTEAGGVVTAADRLLWARLDLITFKDGKPLRELIKRRKPTARIEVGDD